MRTIREVKTMTRGKTDYCYFWLLENELFIEAELELLFSTHGYNMKALNDAVHYRYGYRSVLDLMRERDS
jgi:hypothetical protein